MLAMYDFDEDDGPGDVRDGEGFVDGKVSIPVSSRLEGAAKVLALLRNALAVEEAETATYGILPTEGALLVRADGNVCE